MQLIAKVIIILSLVSLFISFFNMKRKRAPYGELKKIKVLDNRYYKVIFISNTILYTSIIIISLVSPKINSSGLYTALCALMVLISLKLSRSICFKKMYIEKTI